MKIFEKISVIAALAALFLAADPASQSWSAPTDLMSKGSLSPARSGPIAKVEGFRSARFGMSSSEVTSAILKDFRILKKNIKMETHPSELTKNLLIDVDNLIPNSGKARIAYIFGYKSRKLSQVNILWRKPENPPSGAQGPIGTANLLRVLFLKKGFAKDKYIANRRLKDGSIIVFRGADRRGRMVLLFLNNPLGTPEQAKKKTAKERAELSKKITLMLSYMETPKRPDIFKIKSSDF